MHALSDPILHSSILDKWMGRFLHHFSLLLKTQHFSLLWDNSIEIRTVDKSSFFRKIRTNTGGWQHCKHTHTHTHTHTHGHTHAHTHTHTRTHTHGHTHTHTHMQHCLKHGVERGLSHRPVDSQSATFPPTAFSEFRAHHSHNLYNSIDLRVPVWLAFSCDQSAWHTPVSHQLQHAYAEQSRAERRHDQTDSNTVRHVPGTNDHRG